MEKEFVLFLKSKTKYQKTHILFLVQPLITLCFCFSNFEMELGEVFIAVEIVGWKVLYKSRVLLSHKEEPV